MEIVWRLHGRVDRWVGTVLALFSVVSALGLQRNQTGQREEQS